MLEVRLIVCGDEREDTSREQKISAAPGTNLLSLLQERKLFINASCGGHGTCGKCRVRIDEGEGEKEVLACRTVLEKNCTIRLPERQEKTRIMTGGLSVQMGVDPDRSGYLLAYDIGTTTVVCYLLDGRDGRELACTSMLNPQTRYGGDVISRIQAAMQGKMEELTALIRDCMGSLLREACQKAGVSPEEIRMISVVGNPCMQQLFLGIVPENLAKVPFDPVLTKADRLPAAEYLPDCPEAELLVVPDISGYVGADTMGCVLSTKMYESDQIILMVDIGTNGEMVLGSRAGMTACSTAAGPALEGAGIKFGMRGAPGAIDHVYLEDGKIRCSVIGDAEAVGICGSGLIDAAAVMRESGAVNFRGRIQTAEKVPGFAEYLDEIDGEYIFRLTDRVYITQTDVRAVQMAKGAIAAGIELMAEQLDISLGDISEVLLAGAFGSFIDPESACAIGLLPSELKGKIRAVGNAAGIGAKMLACSDRELTRSERLLHEIRFIELAALPEFQRCFAKNMRFQ